MNAQEDKTLDEPGFITSMKKDKKSQRAIQAHVTGTRAFETHLAQADKTLETATPNDLRSYASRGEVDIFGIWCYYEYTDNIPMWATASDLWSAPNYQKFKLKEFMDIDQEAVAILKRHGIVTAPQMVAAGNTPPARAALAEQTGLPEETILELVKLADQARIGGHKRVHARLFYNAGLDTIDKISALEPEEVRQILIEYIERTGFPGIPSTPKEAAHSVNAGALPSSPGGVLEKEKKGKEKRNGTENCSKNRDFIGGDGCI